MRLLVRFNDFFFWVQSSIAITCLSLTSKFSVPLHLLGLFFGFHLTKHLFMFSS